MSHTLRATTLPAGQTIRGDFSMGGGATGAGSDGKTGLSFVFPLSSSPTTHFINSGDSTPAGCLGDAGNPGASAGHLCVFEDYVFNVGSRGVGAADKFGAKLFSNAAGVGDFESSGTWAVTGG